MTPVWAELRRFIGVLAVSARAAALAMTFVLVVLVGLTDGIGLLLFIPLLESLDGKVSPGGTVGGAAIKILAQMGMEPSLSALTGLLLALICLRATLIRGRDLHLAHLRLRLTASLRIDLYRAITRCSWAVLSRFRGGELSAALLSEMDRVGQGIFFILKLPARMVMALAGLVVAFLLAPGLSLLALITGLALAWGMRGRIGVSLRLGEDLSKADRRLHGEVSEFLMAIKITKSYAAERRHLAAFANATDDITEKVQAAWRGNADSRFVQDVTGAAAVAAFVWGGVTLWHLPTPQLLLLVLIFYRLLPLIQEMQQAVQQILHVLPSFTSAMATRDRCEAAAEPIDAPNTPPILISREIRFENIQFTHPTAAAGLRGLDLTLPAGSLTVLLGPSGGGKTTLLDLLVGLLEPTAGRILIDGRPRAEIPISAWRRSVAYVPQDAFLFHDSIRANLAWARPDATEEEIRRCLTLASADFVFSLPAGLDSVVGDRGTHLSGGERQRLALARALLCRPSVLVLDEATAALDAESESLVVDAVTRLRGKVIIIAVTHRPAVFRQADQVLSLTQGRLEPVPGGGGTDMTATVPPTQGLRGNRAACDNPRLSYSIDHGVSAVGLQGQESMADHNIARSETVREISAGLDQDAPGRDCRPNWHRPTMTRIDLSRTMCGGGSGSDVLGRTTT